MSDKIQARVTHQFTASAEAVYDAWLDPLKVRRWLAAALQSGGLAGDIRQIEIDPQVGGKFFFSDLRGDVEACHWGTYQLLDRPRKIVFTWIVDASQETDPSVVTLSIEPNERGCLVTLVHEMDAQWIDYRQRTEQGWSRMLTQIEAVLAPAT